MSHSPDKPPRKPPRNKGWITAWSIFLAATFGFGWYKSAENARDWRVAREWNARHQQLMTDGKAEWTRLIARFRSLQSKPDSQSLLEEELNGGRPLELRRQGSDDIFEWTEPQYGGKVRLKFRNGVLQGWNAHWGSGRVLALYPQPLRQADRNAAEQFRQWVGRAGFYVWLAACVVWMVAKPWRPLAAQLMLAAALVSGMAWLVHPGYDITWRGVFSNDSLLGAASMIAFSVYLLARTCSTHLPEVELAVPRFRFGLRQLLVVVAVAAVLLAAGPFGFVVFCVAVAGTALFAVVYGHYRSRDEAHLAERT